MDAKQYYRLHIIYFVALSIIGSLLLWIPKSFSKPTTFINALYNLVSALTVTGLVSTSAQDETVFDGFILTTFMILGSQLFTSLAPLLVRKHKVYCQIQALELQELQFEWKPKAGSHYIHTYSKMYDQGQKNLTKDVKLSFQIHVEHQRSSLQLEQHALILLSKVVFLYYIGLQVLGFVVTEIFVVLSPQVQHVLQHYKIHHIFFSWFIVVSMFNNTGYSVVTETTFALRTCPALLLWLGLMILIGNTMFPLCLRLAIFFLHHFSNGDTRLAYHYLLHHPNKFYAHLFPHAQTIWLLITIVCFNGIQTFCLLMFEWNSPALEGLNALNKLAVAVFESITTRTAGSGVVNIWMLSPPMLIVYIVMMYISVYPAYLSRKTTTMSSKASSYKQILKQSRKLLAKDSTYLVTALFLLCLTENRKIAKDGLNFSIFNILFEIISGYGNVGLSVGYSGKLSRATSCTEVPFCLSGLFTDSGKMVVIVVMLLGRHRNLYQNIDEAITFP